MRDDLEIVEECHHKDAEGDIEGHFVLSDGSKTKFCLYKQYGSVEWQQWGNTTDKLGVSVDRIEQLVEELGYKLTERE